MTKSIPLLLGLALTTWLALGRGDWPRAFASALSGTPEGGTELKIFVAMCVFGFVLALFALARGQTDEPPETWSGGLALIWASTVAGAVLGAGTEAPLSFGGLLFGAVSGFFVGIPLFFTLGSFVMGVTVLCGLPGLLLWGLLAQALPFIQHFGVTGIAVCMGVCGVIGGGLASRVEDKLELYQVRISRALVGAAGGWLLGLIATLAKLLVQ